MYNKQSYLFRADLKKAGIYELLDETGAIVAGGAIRAIFANEYISDIDVFFNAGSDINAFSAKILELGYKSVFESPAAHTFSNGVFTVQAIKVIYGNASEIINQFDYTVCMGAYDCRTNEFVLHDYFIEHIARRELYYNIDAKFPLSSIFRLKKYLKKGYTIPGTELIKLCLSMNKLEIKTYTDLKNQLMGIDTNFLSGLVSKLMEPEYSSTPYNFADFMTMVTEYMDQTLESILEEME
jgi:hypothetical protein